jgi:hypothetical protein
MMALHSALKPFSLAHSNNFNKFLAFENIDQHPVAGLNRGVAI